MGAAARIDLAAQGPRVADLADLCHVAAEGETDGPVEHGGEVARHGLSLAGGVLSRGRRGSGAACVGIWDGRTVADRPDPVEALDTHVLVDLDPPLLVERYRELGEARVWSDAGGPDDRAGGH